MYGPRSECDDFTTACTSFVIVRSPIEVVLAMPWMPPHTVNVWSNGKMIPSTQASLTTQMKLETLGYGPFPALAMKPIQQHGPMSSNAACIGLQQCADCGCLTQYKCPGCTRHSITPFCSRCIANWMKCQRCRSDDWMSDAFARHRP